MVTLGLIGPGSLLLAAAYFPGCGRIPIVTLLTAAMGFSGFTIAGHSVNHLDIAPPFAGILFAMTNSFGTTSGFIGPVLAGALTDQNDTRHSWQMFFLISGAVYACGGFLFVLFARGDVQSWAKVKDTDREIIVPSDTYGSVQANADDECTDYSNDIASEESAYGNDITTKGSAYNNDITTKGSAYNNDITTKGSAHGNDTTTKRSSGIS